MVTGGSGHHRGGNGRRVGLAIASVELEIEGVLGDPKIRPDVRRENRKRVVFCFEIFDEGERLEPIVAEPCLGVERDAPAREGWVPGMPVLPAP